MVQQFPIIFIVYQFFTFLDTIAPWIPSQTEFMFYL